MGMNTNRHPHTHTHTHTHTYFDLHAKTFILVDKLTKGPIELLVAARNWSLKTISDPKVKIYDLHLVRSTKTILQLNWIMTL